MEKALGSIVKSGTTPIRGVFGPGERVTTKGLVFAATPASDFVCGTLQLAASMNMHVFTTGRGTPMAWPWLQSIKVASRTSLARRWSDLIDVDAGRIATGHAGIEEVGERSFASSWKSPVAAARPAPITGVAQRIRSLQSCPDYLTTRQGRFGSNFQLGLQELHRGCIIATSKPNLADRADWPIRPLSYRARSPAQVSAAPLIFRLLFSEASQSAVDRPARSSACR